MTRRRSRLTELLATSNLAQRDIEVARAKAQRDSANFKNATQALASLVPGIAGIYGDTVKRDEDKKEKQRLEKREDDALLAKLSHAEKLEQTKAEREAAKLKAEQEAKAAEAAAKAKAAEQARADAMDRESAEMNLKSFAQEDGRKAHEDKLALEREKLAAKSARSSGGGHPKPPTEKETLDIEAKKLAIEKAKRDADKDAKAPEEKKRAQVLEVDGFVSNINDNIDALVKQIEDKGTFEIGGTHKEDMERRINAIATDMAKLADPGSVAREGEVAMMQRGLFKPNALGTSNTTAIQLLKNLRDEVEKRRANAYRVRGLDVGAAPAVSGSGVQRVETNPDDDPFADLR